MKKIKLSQNKYALVDDEDFDSLSKYKWMAKKDKKKFYVARHSQGGNRKLIFMHRVIMNTPTGLQTDHINGDGLNNRRSNLRICTQNENQQNRGKRKDNTSGFKGVFWHEEAKKWRAGIGYHGKMKWLGLFKSKIEAYEVYCKACLKYHGNFSRLI